MTISADHYVSRALQMAIQLWVACSMVMQVRGALK